MYRKLAVVSASLLVLLAALLCSASVASAAKNKALRYRVVKHARTYDVVKGHGKKLVVRDHARYVKVHGVRRYEVVKHAHAKSSSCVRVSDAAVAAAGNTPISTGHVSSPRACPRRRAARSRATARPPATTGRPPRAGPRARSSYPQWWMVDLGSAHDRHRRQDGLVQRRQARYRYRIETSLDGVTFTTAADRSKNQTKGVTTDAMSVPARYVRVQVLGASVSGAWASANEVTVYAPRRRRRPPPDADADAAEHADAHPDADGDADPAPRRPPRRRR